jgi:hypothetical protein
MTEKKDQFADVTGPQPDLSTGPFDNWTGAADEEGTPEATPDDVVTDAQILEILSGVMGRKL